MNKWSNTYKLPALVDPRLGEYLAPFFGKGIGYTWFTPTCAAEYIEAYFKCPPISSIIGKKATAFTAGNFEVLNPNTHKYVRGAAKDWEAWLANPNPFQTREQFFKQLYTYLAINGWAYVLKIQPVGFSDSPPAAWWVLPIQFLEIQPVTGLTFPPSAGQPLRRVFLNVYGKRVELNPDNLVLFTDSGCTMIDPFTFLPYSRLRNLQYPISNAIGSNESRHSLIHSRGAMGILSSAGSADAVGPLPLTKDEKASIQDQYRQYGLTGDQWQVIITQAALKWQPMTQSVKDLMLHEEYLDCYKDIAEAYNYPFTLTAFADKSTYNNVSTNEVTLYQNAIIPESADIIGPLNKALNTDKVIVQIDYTVVPCLQQSEKTKGEALKVQNEGLQIMYQNGVITKNQWLEAVGMDIVSDPSFNEYKTVTNVAPTITGQTAPPSPIQNTGG